MPVVKTGSGAVSVDLTGQMDDNQSILLQLTARSSLAVTPEHLAWGYPGAPGEEGVGYELDRSVIRLNADGSLDTTFGEGGVHIVSTGIDPRLTLRSRNAGRSYLIWNRREIAVMALSPLVS